MVQAKKATERAKTLEELHKRLEALRGNTFPIVLLYSFDAH